jgi:Flp pilus assembly protein TadD
MAKKKIAPRHNRPAPSARMKQLRENIEALDDLIYRLRWGEAAELLNALVAEYPNESVLLSRRARICAGLGDSQGEADALEQLHLRSPRSPEVLLGLIGALTRAARPALALRAAQKFLSLAPSHEEAPQVRALAASLEEDMSATAARFGLGQGPEALAALQAHEEILIALQSGDFAQGAALATELLGRHPGLISVRNNLALLYAVDGRLDEALAEIEQVLAQHPGNLHALANRVRALCLAGRVEEAREWAARLMQAPAANLEALSKQAEALTILGDDQGVARLYEAAGPAGAQDDPTLCHFAAVAYARLGHEEKARQLWLRARLSPWMATVTENLEDLSLPPGERSGAWAFPIKYWVSSGVLEELMAAMAGAPGGDEGEARRDAARGCLARRPALLGVLPILLDRGDPPGREFALRLCKMARTPECLEMLRAFASDRRGPDEMRMQAAVALVDAGVLPAAKMRMWIGGAWADTTPMSIEVHEEPTRDFPEKVAKLYERALMLLKQGAAVQAERLLRQAIEQAPGSASLMHNLATSLMLQGRRDEAMALIEENHRRHPDYLFARVMMALHCLGRGEVARAEELLRPLALRRRMHTTEAVAYAGAQAELALAQGEPDMALSWTEMIEEFSPGHPSSESLRRRVALASQGGRGAGARARSG